MLKKLGGFLGLSGSTAIEGIEASSEFASTLLAKTLPKLTSRAGITKAENLVKNWKRQLVDAEFKLEKEANDVVECEEELAAASTRMSGLKKKLAKAKRAKDTAEQERIMAKGKRMLAAMEKVTHKLETKEKPELVAAQRTFEQINKVHSKLKNDLDEAVKDFNNRKETLRSEKNKQTLLEMQQKEAKMIAGLEGAFDKTSVAFDALDKAAEESKKKTRIMELELEELREKSNESLESLLADDDDEPKSPKNENPFADF